MEQRCSAVRIFELKKLKNCIVFDTYLLRTEMNIVLYVLFEIYHVLPFLLYTKLCALRV